MKIEALWILTNLCFTSEVSTVKVILDLHEQCLSRPLLDTLCKTMNSIAQENFVDMKTANMLL